MSTNVIVRNKYGEIVTVDSILDQWAESIEIEDLDMIQRALEESLREHNEAIVRTGDNPPTFVEMDKPAPKGGE